MIYFIQCGEGGPIKIGTTSSAPHARMSYFQLGCPYELRLLGAAEGDRARESEIHERHLADHIRGEWFAPSEAVMKTINEILASNSIAEHWLGDLPKARTKPRRHQTSRATTNDSWRGKI